VQRTLWGTPLESDVPGLHSDCARRVKEAVEWFARGTGECWARIETIAKRADVGKRTAQKWVSAFVRWGWINVVRRGGNRSALRAVKFPALKAPRRHQASKRTPVGCAVSCAPAPTRAICIEEGKEVKTPWSGDGVRAAERGKKRTQSVKPGSLPHLTPAMLADPSRLGTMLGSFLRSYGPHQAAARERDPRTLLRWFGLARRALRVGRQPGALFRSLLAGKRWDWISQEDEDGARRDVAEFLHGRDTARRRELSADDIVAQAVDHA